MKSRLIAAVTAFAVALGGLAATPALAEKRRDNDALKIILGAAAVGLIINELDKNGRGGRAQPAQIFVPPFGNDDGYYRNRDGYFGDRDGYYRDRDRDGYNRDWHRDRDQNRSRRAHRVPSECVYDVRTSNGRRDVVSASCMRQFGLARSLPRECSFQIRTNSGRSTVYGPNCLKRYGWRVSGRY